MLIPLLSAGNFVIGMGAFVVIGMLDPIAGSFGIGAAEAGLVLTVYALAYAAASPVAVAATGGWARRTVLVAGLALFAAAAVLSAMAPTPVALLAARALAALGAGLFTPNAAAVALSCSPPERRGAALSNVFFGLTLAQVLGVPAGGFAAYAVGWPASFLVVAALAAPVLIGLWRLTPPDLAFQPTRLATLGGALADWRTLVAVLFTATYLGAIYVPYTYLGPLLTATMGWRGPGIAATLLVFGLGAVAGNLIGGRLSDRIGPARTLAGLALAQVALMPLLSSLPLAPPLALGLVFVWSVCGWSFMAPQQALLVRLAPDRPNVVLALNAAAIYVGAAAGSAAGAAVIARFGPGALGLAGGLAGVLAVANLWVARRAAEPATAT
jgi:predicted MFS family arabinose efflux permease